MSATQNNKLTIPPKNRPEWRQIVTAQLDYKFSNFVLQMKMTFYSQRIANNQMTVEEAIDDIYALCEKYIMAVQNDCKQIFKSW